jgi:putative transposase
VDNPIFTSSAQIFLQLPQLYVHLVWSTYERHPLITPEIQEMVYSCIHSECKRLRVDVLAIGGIADHVHLLLRFPASISLSSLVKQIKGSTSHLVTNRSTQPFKWQGGYGAFTVSKKELDMIAQYISNQESHHHESTIWPSLERTEP